MIIREDFVEAGIDKNMVIIEDTAWLSLIRPLGFDAGIRSLARGLQELTRKVAKKIVEGQSGPFRIGTENLREYFNE